MDENFHKKGFHLSIQNAENLFDIAQLAAEREYYGNACAINVLAAEEAVKAAFLIIPHYYKNAKINNYEAMFSKHTVKHKELKEYILMQERVRNELIRNIEDIENALEIVSKMNIEKNLMLMSNHNNILEDLNWYKKQTEIKFDIAAFLKWLKNADRFKNDGLYVGKKNNVWTYPNMMTKEKYESEKIFTMTFIKYIKSLEEWLERSKP